MATAIIGTLLLLVVLFIIRYLVRTHDRGGCAGCSGCPGSDAKSGGGSCSGSCGGCCSCSRIDLDALMTGDDASDHR